MERNEISRVLQRLDAGSVGFFPTMSRILYDHQPTNSYPPHNILRDSDTAFSIELAVAGFAKEHITVTEHQGLLTVTGSKPSKDNDYQYRGIADRDFTKEFRIAEYYEVVSTTYENGLLTVRFVQNIPESKKPKVINII